MAAVDGGTLLFVGEATFAAPATVFIQSAAASMAGASDLAADLKGTFGGIVAASGDATISMTPTVTRLGELDVSGDGDFDVPLGQPQFVFEQALTLEGQATVTLPAEMALAGSMSLAGEADITLPGQTVLGGAMTAAGEADISWAADLVVGGELDISGDAVIAADALDDDEGAVDFRGGSSVTANMNVAYDDELAISAGSKFVALAIVIPPLVEKAPLPEQPEDTRFEGLQLDRPPHARPETIRIDTGARSQLVDRDETEVKTGALRGSEVKRGGRRGSS